MMKKQIAPVIIVWLVVLSALLWGWPRPAGVPGEGRWTVTISYEHPEQISITLPGGQGTRSFWYMIVSLTNETPEEEVSFYPKFELVTDTFEVIPSGIGVPEGLFERVKGKHQGRYPFLESMDFTDHRIRRGADNTRDFAVFWTDFDPKAKSIQFYLAGLSNETTAIDHPIQVDEAGRPIPVYLQKTLQLNYSIGADPQLRRGATLRYEGQDWVMR